MPPSSDTPTARSFQETSSRFRRADGLTAAQLHFMREHARTAPDAFWRKEAERVTWTRPFERAQENDFTTGTIRWFPGGEMNITRDCLDRHVDAHPDKIGLIWVPDDEDGHPLRFTFAEMKEEVCRMADVLRTLGVKRGDPVAIYLPMIPHAVFAMLACARLGAPHCVVFSGFSEHALAERLRDSGAKLLITADFGKRGGVLHALKVKADAAAQAAPALQTILLIRRGSGSLHMEPGRDVDYETLRRDASPDVQPTDVGSEDPLFILYTSGSTGKPKGLLHAAGGYAVWASFTHAMSFDPAPDDVFWCTADIGWITGHTYLTYGPLLNGSAILIHEGVPHYPDYSRWWKIVDEHRVSVFYTAPTAIRALMGQGDAPVKTAERTSLRLLGTVGEPINPAAWEWYHDVVGDERCPVADTWWQTETGGHMIVSVPGLDPHKPGAAGKPLPGVAPVLLCERTGTPFPEHGEAEGALCFAYGWPGQAVSVYGDHERFIQTYFTAFPGYYFSGDGAKRDAEGDYRISGRMDDTLNVSGHRLGTEEIESALVSCPEAAEAAVVAEPHPVKGEAVRAYVTLKQGFAPSAELTKKLKAAVRSLIGPVAVPDTIIYAPGVPKTRSGKIMRRILRKIAAGETEAFGDVNTLVNPEIIPELIALERADAK